MKIRVTGKFIKCKGFTLMEILISMLVISVILAVSAPAITMFSQKMTGLDKNVMGCITNNVASWYNGTTGATTLLTDGSVCDKAISSVRYNRGRALDTSTWMANNGSSDQQAMARKILRAACDQDGQKACDYFINVCWKNGSGSAPYCDKDDFGDITYYLHQTSTTENPGAIYIYKQLEDLLPKMMTNLVNEISYSCSNNQTPNNNQNLNNNMACTLISPWFYIKACNMGIAAACLQAYNNNYNRGCAQVKLAWADAPSGNYQLTADGEPPGTPTRQVYCDMSSVASAAITGCSSGTYVSSDCTYGYNNRYNRTCDQLTSSWPDIPTGETYNITGNGPPPTAPVSYTHGGVCPPTTPPDCPYAAPGATAADGTRFVGAYNGYCYYTSAADEPGFPTANGTYQWGASGTSISYANSTSDGMFNTTNILNRGLSDTYAARACKIKSDNNDNGHNDWFLPAYNELFLMYNEKSSIGGFSAVRYWISGEYDDTYANYVNFSGGSYNYQSKDSNSRVRCARKERYETYTAPDPSSCTDQPGNVCADGTIYAGSDATYNYFTTPYDEPAGSYPKKYMWGAGGYTIAATSVSDGMANTTAILASGIYNIEAAKACKAKNDNSHNGRTDWYLPAPNELIILVNNKSLIGGFSVARYWTSRRHDETYAYFVSSSDGSSSFYGKFTYYPVRCVRKELKI